MDEGGGLEGLAGLLRGHPGLGEPPQLGVDEREEVGGGRVQELGDRGHPQRLPPARRRIKSRQPRGGN